MQDTLLDILILGLLVLLFGSIYRTRRTFRLRYWIAGWLFILAHFALLLPNPASIFWSDLTGALGIAALILGGMCFLLASSTACIAERPKIGMQALLSIPVLLFVIWHAFGITNIALLSASFLLLESAFLIFVMRCWQGKRVIVLALTLCAVAATIWAGHDFLTHKDLPGIYAILTQIYLANAIVYWYGFRRHSMGVITAAVWLRSSRRFMSQESFGICRSIS
jgi:hypothetical protein